MNNYLQPYNAMQLQELQGYAMRRQIETGNRLYEHHIRNQMDIQKTEAAEKIRSDVRKEKEYQRNYLLTGPDGEEVLVGEKFLENMKKDLKVRNFTAFRLHSAENRGESVLLLQFRFGPDGKGKEVELFLDEKRLGDQRYVKRVFASRGISFRFKKAAEEETRKLLIEKAQAEARDITIPEIPGWYHTGSQWEYGFPGDPCWKEVTRWTL